MFELSVQNERGDVLKLSNNPNYDILAVYGLNPAPAAINTTAVSGMDGTRYNSARINERNVVISLNINGDIEENRINLYKYFMVKKPVRIFYKNEHVDVYIDGFVETFENDFFKMLQQPQISIICPNPYWRAINETEIDFDTVTALFEFPFAIDSVGIPFSELSEVPVTYFNAGSVETGGIITFMALADDIINPIFYNVTNNTFFGLSVTMQESDTIVINTQRSEKSVYLIRSGVKTSLLNNRIEGSTWIVFEPGMNEIRYSATSGQSALKCVLSSVQLFEGV